MAYCVIPNCGSKLQDRQGLSFHEFPCRGQRREEWIRVVQAVRHCGPDDPWYPSEKSRVCSRHFLPADYRPTSKRIRLSPNAVPSVFPGQPNFPAGKDGAVSRRSRTIKRTVVVVRKKGKKTTVNGELQTVSADTNKQANESAERKANQNCGKAPSINTCTTNQTVGRRRAPNILRVSKAQTAPEKQENTTVPKQTYPSETPRTNNSGPLVIRIGGGHRSPPRTESVASGAKDSGEGSTCHDSYQTQSTLHIICTSSKAASRQQNETSLMAERVEEGRRRSVGCQTSITCHGIDNQRNRIADLSRQYEALQSIVHKWEVKNVQLAREVQKLRPQKAEAVLIRPKETTLFLKRSNVGVKRRSVAKAKSAQKVARFEDDKMCARNTPDGATEALNEDVRTDWVVLHEEVREVGVQESPEEIRPNEDGAVVDPLLVPEMDTEWTTEVFAVVQEADDGLEKEMPDITNGAPEILAATED